MSSSKPVLPPIQCTPGATHAAVLALVQGIVLWLCLSALQGRVAHEPQKQSLRANKAEAQREKQAAKLNCLPLYAPTLPRCPPFPPLKFEWKNAFCLPFRRSKVLGGCKAKGVAESSGVMQDIYTEDMNTKGLVVERNN